MTVAELFKSLEWPPVRGALIRLYPDEEPSLSEYEKVFAEVTVKECAADKEGMTVHVRFVSASEFSDEGYDVSGRLSGDDTPYGLDFSTFSQWASYMVAEETLAFLPPEEIAAHILWEMTFYGFTDAEIRKKKKKLEKAVRDVKSGKAKLISMEEMFGKFKEELKEELKEEFKEDEQDVNRRRSR